MTTPEATALLRILQDAQVQLARLAEGSGQSPRARDGLHRSCLELTLESIAAHVGPIADSKDPANGPLTSAAHSFRAGLLAYRKGSVDAHKHLFELAQRWVCSDCQGDVPIAAAARASAGSTGWELFIVCADCETPSPAHRAGVLAFREHFGHFSTDWDPTRNGFAPFNP